VTPRKQLSRIVLAAAGIAAGAALVAPAGAADKPVPCNGTYLVTDKAGDQAYDASGLGGPPMSAQDNADITGLFFDFTGGKLTANIEIAKLDKTVPTTAPGATGGIWYYVVYSYKGQAHFVRAANRTGGDIEYATGTIDSTGVYKTDATTNGQFIEGEKGIISIEVPPAAGGKEGETLASAGATADYLQGADDQAGLNDHVDTAPNDFDVVTPNGKTYKVAPCTAGPTGAAGVLPVTAPKTLGKAKKAKKGKSISVTLTSTAPITGLSAKLKKKSGKGATLATGKLAQLDGTGKMKLKLKKTLKKGKYALLATGTVDGATQSAKLGVKLK
jgi:hypothetical protein